MSIFHGVGWSPKLFSNLGLIEQDESPDPEWIKRETIWPGEGQASHDVCRGQSQAATRRFLRHTPPGITIAATIGPRLHRASSSARKIT